MDVIFHSADRANKNFVIVANTSYVGPEFGLKTLVDQLPAFCRTENDVLVVFGKGMGHVSRLRRSNLHQPIPSASLPKQAKRRLVWGPVPRWATFVSRWRA